MFLCSGPFHEDAAYESMQVLLAPNSNSWGRQRGAPLEQPHMLDLATLLAWWCLLGRGAAVGAKSEAAGFALTKPHQQCSGTTGG